SLQKTILKTLTRDAMKQTELLWWWNLTTIIDTPQKLQELDEMTPDRVGFANRNVAAGCFLDDPAKLLGALRRKDSHTRTPFKLGMGFLKSRLPTQPFTVTDHEHSEFTSR